MQLSKDIPLTLMLISEFRLTLWMSDNGRMFSSYQECGFSIIFCMGSLDFSPFFGSGFKTWSLSDRFKLLDELESDSKISVGLMYWSKFLAFLKSAKELEC